MEKEKKNIKDEKKEISEKPKKKNKIGLLIKILILLLIVTAITIFAIKIFTKKADYKDKATYTTSFFIRNNKGKYALFNEKGKKITDFIYDSANSLINDSALVYKEKEGYAVINNKGKKIVPFGEYNYITSYSGLYKVRSDKGYKLLDSKGKTILDAEDIDVSSYGEDYPFIVVTVDNQVKLLSYDAKTIKDFKLDKSAKQPTVNHVGEYATIFYNGENVVFNSRTKKIITTFKNDVHYCVNTASENGKILSLNTCASWFETVSEKGHILLVKGTVNDLSKKCDSLQIYENTPICLSSSGEYFIDINGKNAKVGEKINSRSAFVDSKNYVTRDDKTFKLVFYKNNKKVKTMDATLSVTGYMNNDMYVLYVDGSYEYYNLDGKKVIKDSFKHASSFDKNGLARVSKDGSTYYLINEKGKKISDEYNSISLFEKYYQVTNKDAKKGIINKKGKEIVSPKYKTINVRIIRDTNYCIAVDESGKYSLYNLDKNKLIKESKDTMTINEHYIKVAGKKTSYYTYKDKLIYEE